MSDLILIKPPRFTEKEKQLKTISLLIENDLIKQFDLNNFNFENNKNMSLNEFVRTLKRTRQ